MSNKKWFMSSMSDGDLSLTIKGLLTSIIPLILITAHLLGHDLTSEKIDMLITLITGTIASVVTVIGLARKIINWFKDIDSI